jgi:hypothetical protein
LIHFLSLSLWADASIEYTFANCQITANFDSDYLEFDVMANSSSIESRIGTGVILINYNVEAFGAFIFKNQNVDVNKGELLSIVEPSLYHLFFKDNQNNTLAITFEYFSNSGLGNHLLLLPKQLVHIKMKIAYPQKCAGLSFANIQMDNQQYLDDNLTFFHPVIANDTNNMHLGIPLSPSNLAINLSGNVLTLSWESIPECNYTIYSANSIQTNENWQIEATSVTQNSWSRTIQENENIKFYFVTAEYTSELRE